VQAWAAIQVYNIEKKNTGRAILLSEKSFSELLINFTWWINRKDAAGNNLFEGGFRVGYIGVFNRSIQLPGSMQLEQATVPADGHVCFEHAGYGA
jgi:hypothetical protein